MAITSIAFSSYEDTAELMTDLKTRLDALRLFTNITIDTENLRMTCSINELDFLKLNFDSNKKIISAVSKPQTLTERTDAYSQGYVNAYFTSKAVIFGPALGGSQISSIHIIIGKTNNGKTGISCGISSSTTVQITPDTTAYTTVNNAALCTRISAAETTLMAIPIPNANGDYFKDVFSIRFCEHTDGGRYYLGGKLFWSTEFFMLADS